MPDGPGKYDDLCTLVRERAGADGAIVIVFGGTLGSGVSVQMPGWLMPSVPGVRARGVPQLALRLGRTPSAVRQMAKRLGIEVLTSAPPRA